MNFLKVLKNKLIKNKLVEFGAVRFMKDAPVVIYVLYPKKVNPERYANIQSASAAAQNMLLAAHELGLGAVWVVEYGNENLVRKILDIPASFQIVTSIVLGYPESTPNPPPRKDVESLIHLNTYRKKPGYHTIFPKDWAQNEIEIYRSNGIRATSPFSYAFSAPFKKEFRTELNFFEKTLKYLKLYLIKVFF